MGSLGNSTDRINLVTKIVGVITGSVLCIAGLVLTLLGLSGSIEWVLQAGDLTSRLGNASHGVFFTVIGYLVLKLYRPKIANRNDKCIGKITGTLSRMAPSDLGCFILLLCILATVVALAVVCRVCSG